jgi:hypothetical protein
MPYEPECLAYVGVLVCQWRIRAYGAFLVNVTCLAFIGIPIFG